MFINLIKQNSILLTIISQLFLISLPIKGETQIDSLPPAEPRPQRRSGGTRGECVKENELVTLIVPETNQNRSTGVQRQGTDNFQANIPKTTLPRPTFVWHMAQKSKLPVKFTLIEPGKKTIYVEELNLSKAGFFALTLPETVPPLEVGKHYRWTVSILCSRQHPSQNPFTQAWIERITSSNSYLKEKNLSCDTYEKEGIWYDLLACYLKTQSSSALSQLLSRINLNSLIFSE